MNKTLKEKLNDFTEISLEIGAPIVGNMVTDTIIGQIVPGAATAFLSYRQKRTEKMLIRAIDELKIQISEINSKLIGMSEKQIILIKESIFPIVLDNIEKESEEEKIKYIVNGFKHSINYDITDFDLILSYYDILNDLRMIDIRILIDLYEESKKMVRSYMEETDRTIKTEYEAVETYAIKKMESLGLISVKKTFEDLEGRVTKPKKSATKISKLGIYFVKFFEMYKEKDDNNEWRFTKIHN